MAHILVVDDEEGLRSFLAEALEMEGHRVTQAPDGVEGARLVSTQSFDVMLTDIRMPGLNGLELLKLARTRQPELQVIVLTAFGSVSTAVDAMKSGAFDYLQKPISGPTELRLLVARALERRSLLALQDRSQRDEHTADPLSYGDPVMAPVVHAIEKVAATKATVLLLGESGTGKEVAARRLHQLSPRADGAFVTVNCASLSETLLESELFGHEKGAFTGATARRRGRIELAYGGTFFLDEIGEMKPELQAKLLRVLEQRSFERVGGSLTIEVDVRWLAATNRDLRPMIADGSFREDLYHRLAVFPISLPPLRERTQDLLPLAEHLLARVAKNLGRPGLELDDEAKDVIARSPWTGNVRELLNALERAAILADGLLLDASLFASPPAAAFVAAAHGESSGGSRTLADLEREAIVTALEAVDGHRKKAAENLGIGLRTLYDKLKRYEIE
ncbi:MAG: sigma-54-dependent Fis family transcriptional regulator [Deltaproteobacteria bacterium CG_4_9_14_3_um_filter_63_12]|nr:MAG: sigma-54-dependent Fis family transcriptional regulator [Deltaproteobacteria bacterium CG_4_9_14_3_um_filter_63_12]